MSDQLTEQQIEEACDLANELVDFADADDPEISRLALLMAASTYIVECDSEIGFNAKLLRSFCKTEKRMIKERNEENLKG